MGMSGQLKILHLEDSKIDAELIAAKLQEEGISCVIDWVDGKDGYEARLEQGGFDVILADYTLPTFDGLSALRMARNRNPDVPFIFVSGTIGEDRAVETFKNGATDYVLKGELSRLVPSIKRALKEAEERAERKRAEEATRRSEKKYKDLFNSTLDGIFQVDAEGAFILMNPAGARIFGYENPDEIIGRNALEFWRNPKDRDVYREELQRQKKLSAYPMRAKKKNGEPIELESSTRIIENEKENFLGIEGILRDVTARIRTEEELLASAQRWNNTFDAMSEAISILDKDGNILQCNQALLYLLEKLPADIIGHPYWEAVFSDREPSPDCAFSRMQKSHHREYATRQLFTRWFNVTVDPILDPAGNLTGCVHILSDISEHRKFEEQLKESESKFRSLAEQSLVGTYIIQDGKFKYVSPRLAEMFGYDVQEITDHKGPLDLVTPEDHHIVDENMRQRLSGQIPFSHYEVRGRKRSGDIISIEIFGSVMSYKGRPAIIGSVLDVTEKGKLENQLRQAQKMEAVGQLTGGIAHDFNNILSAVIGYAYLLQMQMKADDPGRPYVDQILAGADRAANLTRSLLTFSRKQTPNLKPININENIQRVETLLRRVIGEDIDLRTVLAPQALIVSADAGQIEQVLMNLATNSRDAMQNGGILSIETTLVEADTLSDVETDHRVSHYAVIEVTDTGTGMDEQTREKIFEPFFTTKALGRGTGLGLSMVYGIVKQHNGHIHCYSEPRMGTTFKIYLPIAAGAAAAGGDKSAFTASLEIRGGAETILVVEDDESLRKLARVTLEQFGYTVIDADNGKDAVERFQENQERVRLVLCDVIMPRMSGSEVREAIKKLSPRTPVVFMSGYPADIIQQKSLVDENVDMILKPFSPTALIKKVREVLDRT
jgi:two-component system cell cycle sensor histidine kinase/response regulator CckA